MQYFTPMPENLAVLKKLYKNLCFQYHPDVGGSEEIMKSINHEYAELRGKLKKIHSSTNHLTPMKHTEGKLIKCMFTATRETDKAKLHLLKCDKQAHQWIICWNYDKKSQSWSSGAYWSDFKQALSEFKQKCADYHFDEIVENYR